MYWRTINQHTKARMPKQRLKTKIVATIGPADIKRSETDQKYLENGKAYDELFQSFVQPGHPDCFMVDVIRLNMAFYAEDNEQTKVYDGVFNWVRRNKDGLARHVGILCDLAGAKTRLGKIQQGKGNVEVRRNKQFSLYFEEKRPTTKSEASVLAYGEPLSEVEVYNEILLNLESALVTSDNGIEISIGDGKVILRAPKNQDRLRNGILDCVVEKEGIIENKQGVTFERVDLGLPSFDERDREALKYILDYDNDLGVLAFIGVSFVREANDILRVRKYVENYYAESNRCLQERNSYGCPDIIAKIETEQGVDNINEILDVADGVMIARGDLALQIGREEVPEKQKDIIMLCNQRGRVVITATEMLASMETSPKPTRAEVNDVFNAILDGTDAVMLSGETAKGQYPAEAVKYMASIAERAEVYFEKSYAKGTWQNTERLQELRRGSVDLIRETNERIGDAIGNYREEAQGFEVNLLNENLRRSKNQGTTDRICESACQLAEDPQIRAIIVSTASGRTVRMISRFRPGVDIIGVARNDMCRRKLLLSYGVSPINIGPTSSSGKVWENTEEIFEEAAIKCQKEGLVRTKDNVIFVGGTHLGEFGRVNILQIKEIPQIPRYKKGKG